MAVKRFLAVGDVRGDAESLRRTLGTDGYDAVTLVGDLAAPGDGLTPALREVYEVLGAAKCPAFWIPGPGDSPISAYLRESYNAEIVFPHLRGVHGTFAFAPGHIVFAGMGGRIVDDPQSEREELTELRYPGWEVEHRLKVLREVDENESVLLFATVPAHKGLGQPGSEILAELIKTHSPRVAVVSGGAGVRDERLGSSLVVMPGSLAEGEFAIVDIQHRSSEMRKLD